ncbi:fimbrial protein [Serratia proteamaculans]|uniref:Fimbrial protein n=1 Tax=Serratia proteamaculans TaxID=28151 RepID=A0A5Q2VDC1_SERPR|nr:fimbrial protein [Serratia proteamaculans]QGH61591.1 fimbrial protein [Serratia proteamaculans]
MNNRVQAKRGVLPGQRRRIGLIAVPLVLTMAVMAGLTQPADANPDNWDVEGEHGELHVFGALTEGACRLDMVSAFQQVELGETANGRLQRVGSQGTPVTFHLQLRDCGRLGGRQRDLRTGSLTWDARQPVMTVSFVAPADPDTPALVQTRGVSGVGLRIRDAKGRDIRLGDRGAPQFVTPANDELVYTVTPERTKAPLTLGHYRAVVDFRLNYD